MKPKLLYLCTEDWFFYSHFFRRAIAMQEMGFAVTVVARNCCHGEIIRNAGLNFINLKFERRSFSPWYKLRTLLSIWRVYSSERPDLVHHIALEPILFGTFIARLRGIKNVVNAPTGMGYVFTSNHLLAHFLQPLVLLAMRSLLNPPGSYVIFENQDDIRLLTDKGIVRPDNAVLICGAGIDLARFHPGPEPEGVPVITLTARMLWSKGIKEFVEAARLIKSSGIKARFLLVGKVDKGNPTAIDRNQLLAWQSEGVIEWLGYREDIPAVLAMSHIFCLPSYREGLSQSLLEALAAGKPVVTTDVTGCRDVVTHGDNGLLVPPKDTKLLAAAFEQLIASKELRQKFGARGRIRAVTEFGNDKIIAQTHYLYRQMLGDNRTDAHPVL